MAHNLTVRQQRILKLLDDGHALAVREIAATLELEPRPVRDDLALLKQLGLVRNFGHGRGSYWSLTPH